MQEKTNNLNISTSSEEKTISDKNLNNLFYNVAKKDNTGHTPNSDYAKLSAFNLNQHKLLDDFIKSGPKTPYAQAQILGEDNNYDTFDEA